MATPDATHTVGAIAPGSAPAGITNAASCPTSAFSLLPRQAIQSHRQNVKQFPCVHGTDGVFQQAEKDLLVQGFLIGNGQIGACSGNGERGTVNGP